ncbi:AraC family transcriptional regulator [Bosea sp. BK604]|nr:AraC family transcriptional regulator [Bosea sp. BK604]
MLRSIQHLRDSSSPASRLVDNHEQLGLIGGGPDYRTPWHWHDCLMLFLPHAGAVEFRDESRKSGAWLSEDRFVVVPRGFNHQSAALRPAHRHLAIYASDRQLQTIDDRIGSLSRVRARLTRPAIFAMTADMRSLQALCQGGAAGDTMLEAARGHVAAALLINCLAQIERGEELSGARQEGHGEMLISEIKAFISQNADRALPLDLIADRFGLSRRQVTRLFRDHAGSSIAAFQERERIRQARDLLAETTLPVGEIAWRVGFESGSALARAMRRATGRAPTDIRRGLA